MFSWFLVTVLIHKGRYVMVRSPSAVNFLLNCRAWEASTLFSLNLDKISSHEVEDKPLSTYLTCSPGFRLKEWNSTPCIQGKFTCLIWPLDEDVLTLRTISLFFFVLTPLSAELTAITAIYVLARKLHIVTLNQKFLRNLSINNNDKWNT